MLLLGAGKQGSGPETRSFLPVTVVVNQDMVAVEKPVCELIALFFWWSRVRSAVLSLWPLSFHYIDLKWLHRSFRGPDSELQRSVIP